MTLKIAAAAFALLSAGAATAQELNLFQKLELNTACRVDVEAACAGLEPGEGRLMQCIRDNPEKLSQPCKDTIIRIRADLLGEAGAAAEE